MLTFEHWTLYYNKYIATRIGGKQMTTLHWQQTKFTISLKLYIWKVSVFVFLDSRKRTKLMESSLVTSEAYCLQMHAKHLHKTVPAK